MQKPVLAIEVYTNVIACTHLFGCYQIAQWMYDCTTSPMGICGVNDHIGQSAQFLGGRALVF